MRRLLLAGAVLVAVWAGLAAWSAGRAPIPPHAFFSSPARIIAHRGGGVAAPEATLPAFAAAVEAGTDVLEFDVRLTADGIPVVLHDETVDRTTDGAGPVDAMTLAELRRWNAGHDFRDSVGGHPWRDTPVAVPTLGEVLAAHPGRRMVIEMKVRESVEPLCRDLTAAGRQAITLVAAFETETLEAFRTACPEAPTVASMSEVLTFLVFSHLRLEGLLNPAAKALLVPEAAGPIRVVTPRFLSAAARLGLPVAVWTVNDPDDMERLLDLGVEGILTDDPGTLARLLARRRGG